MIVRLLPTFLVALVVLGNTPPTAMAQRIGARGFSADQSFRWLDQNGDGNIEDRELERFPPLRTWIEERGLHLFRPLSVQEFDDLGREYREEIMMERRRDRESEIEDDDPRYGDDSPSERGQIDDRSRRRFGGFGEGRGRGGDFGGRSEGDYSTPSGPATAPVAASQPSTATTPKLRTPITVKLPDAYKSRDVDGDGQIGLYEWPKSDLATFRKLDRNRDGFLTPRELLLGAATAGTAPVATTVTTLAPSVATPNAAPPTGTPSASTPTTVPATPAVIVPSSQAQTAFLLLDKDKNGTVSAEEWGRSLTTRPAFEKAGIAPQLPLVQSEFLILYARVYPTAK